MTKAVKAKEILKNYSQIGFKLRTSLMDTDLYVFNKKVLVLGLFYKVKKQTFLSDALAQQIINYDQINRYANHLLDYSERKQGKPVGLVYFNEQPSSKQSKIADKLGGICENILQIYRHKGDTSKFDSKVMQFLLHLENVLEVEYSDEGKSDDILLINHIKLENVDDIKKLLEIGHFVKMHGNIANKKSHELED